MSVSAPDPTPRHRGPICLAVGRLELQFHWRADRWAHHLFRDGVACWQSVENLPDLPISSSLGITVNWPASPVFTEVSLVETASGPALLAVGRAGRSHFSASLAAAPDSSDTIVAELACRLHEPPGWLGSTYQPLPPDGPAAPSAGWLAVRPPCPADLQLPATICWAYHLTPAGIRALPPASCGPLMFRSN